ncbi:hypothetical protein H8R18_08200 [Nanchangia anserum]|uniref:Uncharacterized protein n=1 Tax=Nanchangia anserum TaxID=2692125 RepID=A0A8I0GCJ2_9ACTO|nr:hypothetical protein [Nanchangia anserum]MBD3689501.1 hypothetical protein [Nanchangia anserum]QOX81689.1 hypothetical protein H8R18_08200 [Nanchangia anserum]
MIRWLLSRIPAPTWIKVLLCLVVIAAVVLVCFQWVFPWAQDEFHLIDTTVGE